jgi:hypothetical protein
MSAVKSERITILGTPEFQAYLKSEAGNEGVSVSELVRNRCQAVPPDADEMILQELIKTANEATKKASKSLDKGLKEAEKILAELRA